MAIIGGAMVGGVLTAVGADGLKVTIAVDLSDVRAEVPRTLYGTGMEDVNHEIYGGLDAQRLHDESFEETLPRQTYPCGSDSRCAFGLECGRQWDEIATGGGRLAVVTNVAHLGRRSQMLEPSTGTAGVVNRGLNGWGVPCRAGKKIVGHMFVRGSVGRLEVKLQSKDASAVYANGTLEAQEEGEWKKVCFTLVPDTTDPAASIAIVASGGGRAFVDDVYLADEPTNEFGRIGCREDIVDAFRREGVTFLRWGGSMANAPDYLLKNMKGDRRPYEGFWFKTSSTGFMIREFVQMADRMKLPCAFSIYAYDSIEDAVVLAEWLKRFDGFICVQIGNEECSGYTPSGGTPAIENVRRYCKSLRQLVPAMRQANPKLVFASAVMWQMDRMDLMEEAFRLTDGYVDYWDMHVEARDEKAGQIARRAINGLHGLIARLNPKSRIRAAIFEENAHIHDMRRALAHASILEAAREAGGFLLASCPANALQPYMQNDSGWDQGQIFFTPDKAWLQPCGWAQQMASASHRDILVAGQSDDADVTVSATRDRSGVSVVLHILNASKDEKSVVFDFGGADGLAIAKVTSLSALKLEDHNTPDDPDRVSPRDRTEAFRGLSMLLPYSYTVVEFQ